MKFDTFIPPMLLSEQNEPFDDEDYIFELKFDGIRANVHASPRGVKIFSRNGHDVTAQFPELQSIKRIVKSEVIFDGEIVSFEKGKPSFSRLQKRNRCKNHGKIISLSREEPVVFVAFDCIYEKSNLCTQKLLDRKRVLSKYEDTDEFVKTTYNVGKGIKLFKKVVDMGLEGIVAKRKDGFYEPGVRTKEWIKIKNFKVENFVIGGYIENKEKISLLLGEKRDHRLYFVGKVSITRKTDIYKKLKAMNKKVRSSFADYDEEGAAYLPFKYSCIVSYIERTPNGQLRQPVFKRAILEERKK